MSRPEIEHEAKRVKITQGRWTVRIEIEQPDGSVATYLASADSGLTYGDGIWFGTPQEEREELGL